MMEVGFQEPEGFLIDDPRRKDSREFRVKESQWLPVSVWKKLLLLLKCSAGRSSSIMNKS